MRLRTLCFILFNVALAGCETTMLEEHMRQVDQDLQFADLKVSPDLLRGKVFLLGGTVDERTDFPDMTRMRLRHRPLDSTNQPRISGLSEGEFLVISRPPVDSRQYPPGTKVTMVGRLTGFEPAPGQPQSAPLPAFEALFLRTWALPPPKPEKPFNPRNVEPPRPSITDRGENARMRLLTGAPVSANSYGLASRKKAATA